MLFFWVVTLCGYVNRYKRFGEILSPSSVLKMEAVSFSETLVYTYKSTFVCDVAYTSLCVIMLSIARIIFTPEDGGSRPIFIRKVGMSLQPRRPASTYCSAGCALQWAVYNLC
jgi:hypothetical protein